MVIVCGLDNEAEKLILFHLSKRIRMTLEDRTLLKFELIAINTANIVAVLKG